MALVDSPVGDEGTYDRLGGLLDALIECGLASGDNPVIVQDDLGGEYKIIQVTNETGDIGIIIEEKHA